MKGQTCVIDIMGWMYKGAYSTAWDLDKNGEINTSLGFMGYLMKQLKILISYGIKPICVFDGRATVAKA